MSGVHSFMTSDGYAFVFWPPTAQWMDRLVDGDMVFDTEQSPGPWDDDPVAPPWPMDSEGMGLDGFMYFTRVPDRLGYERLQERVANAELTLQEAAELMRLVRKGAEGRYRRKDWTP